MKNLLTLLFIFNLCIVQVFSQTAEKTKISPKLQYADSLFLSGNWLEAKNAYSAILISEVFQNSPLTWNRIGFSCQQLDELDLALQYYQKALDKQPQLALEQVILTRFARVYARKSNKNKALAYLNQAVDRGYNNVTELDNEKDFSIIKDEPQFKALYDKAYLQAFPCMAHEKTRQFDFWVGEWKAYQTGTQVLAGYSKIERVSGGCMILENWNSANTAYNGKSMNYYDPEKDKWEQVWVGSEGGAKVVYRFIDGEYKDGAMRFVFESTNAEGKKLKGRFIFFNEGKNQVRQLNETSADNGLTWQKVYDFTYMRVK